MEPIWRVAEDFGVLVLPAWDWKKGTWYVADPRPAILLPHMPIREERWHVAHELGHHMNPVYIGNPTWLAEAKADRWAVAQLRVLYDVDQVAWPERVWHLLPHWEEIAA